MHQNVSNNCRDRLQLIQNADNYFLRLAPSSNYSSYHIPLTLLKLQRSCPRCRTYAGFCKLTALYPQNAESLDTILWSSGWRPQIMYGIRPKSCAEGAKGCKVKVKVAP
jgi:hypothetical protein